MINSPVQKIKERLTIEEVVSSYIPLIKAGNSLKAKCPFHNEKTPSFFVSPERGSYYCFGCAKGGDIFSFVEEFEGLDFKGALKLLADKAKVDINNWNFGEDQEIDKLYAVMEDATLFFEKNLKTWIKKEKDFLSPIEYLKSRGLEEKTILDFRLGFANNSWDELTSFLKMKGYNRDIIEKAGLAKKKNENLNHDSLYDRFRSRIMFPIMDSSGRVIAFSGRFFEVQHKNYKSTIVPAKYLNSPETKIFSKSRVLYGLSKAKESIRKNNFSILVEGQMDLLMCHQSGWKNTVATSGTALSDSIFSKENNISNLGLIRRLSSNIVLSFDADKAGISATERAGKIALILGMDVKVASIPSGLDPADLILKEGKDGWREIIKNSKHIIEFFLEKIVKDCEFDMRKMGREIKEKLLPYLILLPSSIEVFYFIKLLSDKTGISQDAFKNDLKQIEKDSNNTVKESEELKYLVKENGINTLSRKENILKKLLGIVIWQKIKGDNTIPIDKIIKEIELIINTNIDNLLKTNNYNKEEIIFEAERFYESGKDLILKDIIELFNNLKEEYLKDELTKKMKDLHKTEEEKNDIKSAQILKECQNISSQIEDIKNGRFNFLDNI